MKCKSGLGLCSAEVLLDQELKDLAKDWSIEESKDVARDFERWSKQLAAWVAVREGVSAQPVVILTLDPALEMKAKKWTASKRRAMADVFVRWSKQLLLSALALDQVKRLQSANGSGASNLN